MRCYNEYMVKISLSMSRTQIKKRATAAFFEMSSARPRQNGASMPIAIIMAGLPGSGKTEFVDSLLKNIPLLQDDALRIDLDEIVKVFEEYDPSRDYRFRRNGNLIIESILDRAIPQGYNFILDGTFAGAGAIRNIERALAHRYGITVFVMVEDIDRAREYTRIREAQTLRGVKEEAFGEIADNLRANLKAIVEKNLPVDVVVIRKNWKDGSVIYKRQAVDNIDTIF